MFAAFRNVPLSSLLVDVALCFLAVVIASVTTPNLVGSSGLIPLYWLFLATAFSLTAVFMFACLGLYRPVPLRLSAAFWRMLTASAIAGCLAYPIFEATLGSNYTSLFLPRAIWCLAGCLLVGKYFGSRIRKALRVPRVLIVGTGPDAAMVARDFHESKTMQRNVIGYLATPQDVAAAPADLGKAQVFHGGSSIVDLVSRHGIDEIVVAVRDQRGGNVPMDQLLACRIRGIPVLDLAGCFERARAEVPLDSLKASWLVYGKGFEQGKVRHIVKRCVDIVGSAVLLAVAAPIMLLAAIAVYFTSPGPILYGQERVGFGGRIFMCLKFRSMRSDAEKDGVARWATKNDSRVTPVGAFMRKTRIDELPQLISVLKGELSLIGPRPERPSFVAELRQHIPFYDLRHSIKPGLTGWAQVRCGYGSSIEDARRKHQFDLYYVKNNSLLLDLLILIETVSVVVFREGQ
jgi:sugar transferase (PEP-CTERM system associated)